MRSQTQPLARNLFKTLLAFVLVSCVNTATAIPGRLLNETFSIYDETTTGGLFSVQFSCWISKGVRMSECDTNTPDIPISDAEVVPRILG